ncbi:MAG TPA: ABC transporter substrate-binding protein [Candidatus Limnocylindria bacterium]|nr:ABC transporter substrate-binding protein [Candidatus Limnocylindria bacterium]
MSRRHARTAALLGATILVLAACQPTASESPDDGSAPPSGSGATGGTVRLGIGGAATALNPGNGELAEDYVLYELIYDTPIEVAPTGEFVPELATDWVVSDDGLTWTLTLVEGATFHDGTPLTSEDVKFSLELYRDTPDYIYLPSYPDVFVDIQAPDPTTIVITTSDPVGNFESRMVFMYILPKHIWEAVEDPVAFENEEMIGSGAFKLAEFSQGEFVRLEANDDYWDTPPLVDEVVIQTFTNADARIAALTNGDVDAITEFPATAISTLQNTENIEVQISDVAAGGSIRDVFFNVIDPADCPADGICSGHEALRDVTVRQALATATDKQQIIDVATLGTASPGLGLVPVGLGDFFLGLDADYPYDVDAANQMLDDAGYEDTDGDGVRECLGSQDCDDLTFRFNYPNDIDTGAREAELLDAMWGEIGVNLDIIALEPDALTAVCCPAFDYDVILWGWGSDPDPQFLMSVTTCAEVETGTSETGYCNPEYDEIYNASSIETDSEARIQMIHELQQIVLDEMLYLIPYYAQNTEAFRTDTFTGWYQGSATFGLDSAISLVSVHPVE